MDTLECIKKRRSVRKFLDVPIDWDIITTILEAGSFAPSAGNLQNNKYIVVFDKNKIKKIAESSANQLWINTAPVVIVICSEPAKSKKFYGVRGERLYAIQNSAASAMNILLAAEAKGISSCWVGAFDEDSIRNILSIPGKARPQIIIPLGYNDQTPKPNPRYKINDIMYLDKWGNKYEDLSEFTGWTSVRIEKKLKSAIKTVSDATKKVTKSISEAVKKK